jgi:hypothetical protein
MDLAVIPLDSIRGRVYHDVNQNGQCDPGEGRPGMAVRLSDQVTATDAQGMYGFYNLQPNAYVVAPRQNPSCSKTRRSDHKRRSGDETSRVLPEAKRAADVRPRRDGGIRHAWFGRRAARAS